jgi:glycerophosphoryl diester phosphodiesterase
MPFKSSNLLRLAAAVLPLMAATLPAQQPASQGTPENPWLVLMTRAAAHAHEHGALVPVLSPNDASIVAFDAASKPATTLLVPVAQLQALGIRVIPWTTDEPEKMRAVIRTGVDGLISDRPDILQRVLAEERAARPGDPHLKNFVVSAHRGGRGLRPENTLPSFESGLDQLSGELETDTGVSTDNVSLIWHDQFYNPQSCRRADGAPYTLANRVYLRDISSTDAQKQFLCDKLHFGPDQKNDLALSPVAVAFAKKEGLISPYVPTYVAQLFRFVAFYADYYATGSGRSTAHAAERAANARTVRFNLETKIMSEPMVVAARAAYPSLSADLISNHTRDAQTFVTALAGIVTQYHMEDRAEIQSFDYRTLRLTEEQFPRIPTYYLTEDPRAFTLAFVNQTLPQ